DVHTTHNGGTVRFGPDGRLYASLGEDTNPCAAQDTSSNYGEIVRLDVSRLPAGPGSAPLSLVAPPGNPFATVGGARSRLIWSFGLRNPFRFQVDTQTGDLLIGDVGESLREEVDLADRGGIDFGWPIEEGTSTGVDAGCHFPLPLTGPI